MAFLRYTAKRELAPGHSVGTDYEIEFKLRRAGRSRVAEKRENRSLAGDRETIYYRADETHTVETTLESEASLADWREFAASVEDGSDWQLDLFGTVASPVDLMTGYLVGRLRESRVEPDSYRFGFQFTRVGS